MEPPSNLNMNKVLMLLVKQTAAGFNASRDIFQPSRNATLYNIDTPILSQLGIWFSNIFIDWEGNYCSWSNFVSLLVCPAPFALCSFPAFILKAGEKKLEENILTNRHNMAIFFFWLWLLESRALKQGHAKRAVDDYAWIAFCEKLLR